MTRPLAVVVAVAVVAGGGLLVADLATAGPERPLRVLAIVAAFAAGALVGARSRRGRAGRRRERASEARRDGRRSLASVRSMGRVAEQVAGGDSASFVVLDVARALVELLDLRDCRYDPGPGDGRLPVLRHGGELELRGARWGPTQIGLPEDGFELRMVARGHAEGRFVCLPRRRRPVPEDRVLAAVALVDQAASAQLIERVA